MTATREIVGPVIRAVGRWLFRSPNRSVKLKIGADIMEVSDPTSEEGSPRSRFLYSCAIALVAGLTLGACGSAKSAHDTQAQAHDTHAQAHETDAQRVAQLLGDNHGFHDGYSYWVICKKRGRYCPTATDSTYESLGADTFTPIGDGKSALLELPTGATLRWDRATGAVDRTLPGHKGATKAWSSPDRSVIVRNLLSGNEITPFTEEKPSTVEVWDVSHRAGRLLKSITVTGLVEFAAVDPDDRQVVVSTEHSTTAYSLHPFHIRWRIDSSADNVAYDGALKSWVLLVHTDDYVIIPFRAPLGSGRTGRQLRCGSFAPTLSPDGRFIVCQDPATQRIQLLDTARGTTVAEWVGSSELPTLEDAAFLNTDKDVALLLGDPAGTVDSPKEVDVYSVGRPESALRRIALPGSEEGWSLVSDGDLLLATSVDFAPYGCCPTPSLANPDDQDAHAMYILTSKSS